MRRRFLAGLLLALAALCHAAHAQHYAEFRSWIVGCDNVARCEARGFGDELPYVELRLTRDAGEAAPELRLLASERAAMPAPRLDGVALPDWPRGWRLESAEGNTTATTRDPTAIAAFLERARDARRLTLGEGPEGVPLEGLVASLLRMDDVQGRVGTPGALVAGRGQGRAPEARPLPRLAAGRAPVLGPGEAEMLLAAARRDGAAALQVAECERTRPGIPPDEAHALDRSTALVLLGCGSAAYQDWALPFLVTRTGHRATVLWLDLPTMAARPPRDRVLMNAGFDGPTSRLGTMSKGRGMADCGMSAAWAWRDGAFRLASLARRDRCGGEPGDWLILWRTAE